MKKVYITSIISIMSVVNAFASGITAGTENPECTEPVLGVYSGTTNLQANYNPNIIKLEWYDGNTQITPTNTTATKCTYDLNVIIPENEPTKDGYTFAGWRLRGGSAPTTPSQETPSTPVQEPEETNQCDLTQGGTSYGFISLNNRPGVNEDLYSLTNQGDWAVEFDYGVIKGIAKCSITSAEEYAQTGAPSDEEGDYCWCQATSYTPSAEAQCNFRTGVWAYRFKDVSGFCKNDCAEYCSRYGIHTKNAEKFRTALYGGAQ